jgi:hypothetical protein
LIIVGKHRILIADVTNEEKAHAFVGGVAMHVLVESAPNVHEVVTSAPYIEGGGGFGLPAPWEVRTDLFATPAVVVVSGWAGMGCSVRFQTMYEPIASGPRAVTPPILVAYEDRTTDPIAGRIDPSVRDRSFAVSYSGSVQRVVRFTKDRDSFQPDAVYDDLAGC